MKASFWQKSEALDYKNTTSEVIEENTIVPIKTRIGITGTRIEPGQVGSLHVVGVFKIQKKSNTDVIDLGTKVYYTEDGITASATTAVNPKETGDPTSVDNVPAGYATENSASGSTTILVKLLG